MSASNFGNIQYKASNGQINLDEAQGIVECFVAGIGNKDSVGDICATGAFAKSLQRRKPRVVWGHNWNDPIGKVLEIYEVPVNDPRLPMKMKLAGIGGLYAKVQFNLQSEKGREAFANVAFFGEEQEWSIGYKTLRAQFDQNLQANVLYEVELYEVSPVLHGANQLTGTISVKSDEEKMHGMMPLVIGAPSAGKPSDEGIFEEGLAQRISGSQLAGVVAELSRRAGGPVMVVDATENSVVFIKPGKGKFRIGYHFTGTEYMFGKPELIQSEQAKPTMQSGPAPMPGISAKPTSENKPAANSPAMPMPVAMKPGDGGMVMVPLPPVEYEGGKEEKKPELVAEERELAESLVRIAGKYGKFDEDGDGIWAGYYPPAENKVKDIGVKCANCVLYQGGGKCKILDMQVEDEGKCRFAIIPDGVVVGFGKKEYNDLLDEDEVKMVEDIEAKYPGEFILGAFRNVVKKRRKKRKSYKTLEEWGIEEQELAEKGLDPFLAHDASYVIPVNPEDAFVVKSILDPVFEYHRIDTVVNEYGIVINSPLDQESKDAIQTAATSAYGFLKKKLETEGIEEKALGRRLGRAVASRAIDRPNIGGRRRRGSGMGVPSGDTNPMTREDANLNMVVFDGIPGWEQPDPTPYGPGSIYNPKPSKRQMRDSVVDKPKLSSGKRNERRHADRSAAIEAKLPNAEEAQKRKLQEQIADQWVSQGLGWAEVPRLNSDKGKSSDYLRGRELGVNQSRLMWQGDKIRKRPATFDEKKKASTEYAKWYEDYARAVSKYIDANAKDGDDNWNGIEEALKTEVYQKRPDTSTWNREDAARLDETLDNLGLSNQRGVRRSLKDREPASLSSGEKKKPSPWERRRPEKPLSPRLQKLQDEMGAGKDKPRLREEPKASRPAPPPIPGAKSPRLSSGRTLTDKEIYDRRMRTQETLQEVADDLGVTREEVRKAEQRHMAKLRKEGSEVSSGKKYEMQKFSDSELELIDSEIDRMPEADRDALRKDTEDFITEQYGIDSSDPSFEEIVQNSMDSSMLENISERNYESDQNRLMAQGESDIARAAGAARRRDEQSGTRDRAAGGFSSGRKKNDYKKPLDEEWDDVIKWIEKENEDFNLGLEWWEPSALLDKWDGLSDDDRDMYIDKYNEYPFIEAAALAIIDYRDAGALLDMPRDDSARFYGMGSPFSSGRKFESVEEFEAINNDFNARGIRDLGPYERVDELKARKSELVDAIAQGNEMLKGLDEDSPEYERLLNAIDDMDSNLSSVDDMMEAMVDEKIRLDEVQQNAVRAEGDARRLREKLVNLDEPSEEDLQELSFEDANADFLRASDDIYEVIDEHGFGVDWTAERQGEVEQAIQDGDYEKAKDIFDDVTRQMLDIAEGNYREAEANYDDYPFVGDGFSSGRKLRSFNELSDSEKEEQKKVAQWWVGQSGAWVPNPRRLSDEEAEEVIAKTPELHIDYVDPETGATHNDLMEFWDNRDVEEVVDELFGAPTRADLDEIYDSGDWGLEASGPYGEESDYEPTRDDLENAYYEQQKDSVSFDDMKKIIGREKQNGFSSGRREYRINDPLYVAGSKKNNNDEFEKTDELTPFNELDDAGKERIIEKFRTNEPDYIEELNNLFGDDEKGFRNAIADAHNEDVDGNVKDIKRSIARSASGLLREMNEYIQEQRPREDKTPRDFEDMYSSNGVDINRLENMVDDFGAGSVFDKAETERIDEYLDAANELEDMRNRIVSLHGRDIPKQGRRGRRGTEGFSSGARDRRERGNRDKTKLSSGRLISDYSDDAQAAYYERRAAEEWHKKLQDEYGWSRGESEEAYNHWLELDEDDREEFYVNAGDDELGGIYDAWDTYQTNRENRRGFGSGRTATESQGTPPRRYARMMQMDPKNSKLARGINYDPQNRELIVNYRDGRSEKFKNVDYERVRKAGFDDTPDLLINELRGESGTKLSSGLAAWKQINADKKELRDRIDNLDISDGTNPDKYIKFENTFWDIEGIALNAREEHGIELTGPTEESIRRFESLIRSGDWKQAQSHLRSQLSSLREVNAFSSGRRNVPPSPQDFANSIEYDGSTLNITMLAGPKDSIDLKLNGKKVGRFTNNRAADIYIAQVMSALKGRNSLASGRSELGSWEKTPDGAQIDAPGIDGMYSISEGTDGKFYVTRTYDAIREGGQYQMDFEHDSPFDSLADAKKWAEKDYDSAANAWNYDMVYGADESDTGFSSGRARSAASVFNVDPLVNADASRMLGNRDVDDNDGMAFSSGRTRGQRAAARLPKVNATDKEIFERRMEGASLEDVANELGVPRHIVRQAEQRHMARMRGTLDTPVDSTTVQDYKDVEEFARDMARIAEIEAAQQRADELFHARVTAGEDPEDIANEYGVRVGEVIDGAQRHEEFLKDLDRQAEAWAASQGETLSSGRARGKFRNPMGGMFNGEHLSSGKQDEVYKAVQDRLVQMLENADPDSWEFPWHKTGFVPNNPTNKKRPYSGVNMLMLLFAQEDKGYTTPMWAGFEQWKKMGGTVRKGEKGTQIFIPTIVPPKKDKDGSVVKEGFTFFKVGYVFNADQIDGIDVNSLRSVELDPAERVQELEDALAEVGAVVTTGADGRAFYSPSKDIISMPPFEAFKSKEGYYAVLAHEMMHWTGHSSRLNRPNMNMFGDEAYAQEELIAEIAAAFFLAALGVSAEPREDHAKYLKNWLRTLKNDPNALQKAFSEAQKASDFVIGKSPKMQKRLGKMSTEKGVVPGNKDLVPGMPDVPSATLSSGRAMAVDGRPYGPRYVYKTDGTRASLASILGEPEDGTLGRFRAFTYPENDMGYVNRDYFTADTDALGNFGRWNVVKDEKTNRWSLLGMVFDDYAAIQDMEDDHSDDYMGIVYDVSDVSRYFDSPKEMADWIENYESERREFRRVYDEAKENGDLEKIAELLRQEEIRAQSELEETMREYAERSALEQRADMEMSWEDISRQFDEETANWSAEDWQDHADDLRMEMDREDRLDAERGFGSGRVSRYNDADPSTIPSVKGAAGRDDEIGSNTRHIAKNVYAPSSLYDLDEIRANGNPISFTYKGEKRTIYPTGIKAKKQGGIYFVGVDERSGQYRSFNLEKVEGLVDGAELPVNPRQPGVAKGDGARLSSGRTYRGRLTLSPSQQAEVNALSDEERAYYFRRLRRDGKSHEEIIDSIERINENRRIDRGAINFGSGRKRRSSSSKRRPMSPEEMQAFRDGQRLRARTIPGKKKSGPDASEFSSGRKHAVVVTPDDISRVRRYFDRRPPVSVSTTASNDMYNPVTDDWQVPVAPLLEQLGIRVQRIDPRAQKGSRGEMIAVQEDSSVADLADMLGLDKAEADKLLEPNASIPRLDMLELLQEIYFPGTINTRLDSEFEAQADTDKFATMLFGWNAAPYWYDRDGYLLTREEFEGNFEEKLFRDLRPAAIPDDMPDEAFNVGGPRPDSTPDAPPAPRPSSRKAGSYSKQDFTIQQLADFLGVSFTDRKAFAAEIAKRTNGRIKPTNAIMQNWEKGGVPDAYAEAFKKLGIIQNAEEIWGDAGRAFDESMEKTDYFKRLDALIKASGKKISDSKIESIHGLKGSTVRKIIKREERSIEQSIGVGTLPRYSDVEMSRYLDKVNEELGTNFTLDDIRGSTLSSGRRAQRRISRAGTESAEALSSGSRENNGAPDFITPRMQKEIMDWARKNKWSSFATSLLEQYERDGFLTARQWEKLLRFVDTQKMKR